MLLFGAIPACRHSLLHNILLINTFSFDLHTHCTRLLAFLAFLTSLPYLGPSARRHKVRVWAILLLRLGGDAERTQGKPDIKDDNHQLPDFILQRCSSHVKSRTRRSCPQFADITLRCGRCSKRIILTHD